MRIKGQGYITKKICQKIGFINRAKFRSLIERKEINFRNNKQINSTFDIISISGSKHFEEQILSILSFVENIGIPEKWIVFSDGTYNDVQKQQIRDIFDFVEIKNWNDNKLLYPNFKEALNKYTTNYNIGRKTYTIINYKSENPFLFCDSDLIFYPKFKEYLHLLKPNSCNYFSVDNDWCCLDTKYLNTKQQDMYQLNSGLLFIQNNFEWLPALEYINNLTGKYDFYDQTSVHIAYFNSSNANTLPFDPRLFKVEMSDHFKFKLNSNTKKLAVRHYVGPIRHKMWQKGWEWHLINR